MARTSPTLTQNEVQAYSKFCTDHNICSDDSLTEDSVANANLVWKYFTETWPNDITEENLLAAFPQLQPHLKFYSSREQAEYTQIANENQQNAQTLVAWLNTQGKPGQLVNEGPEAYANLSRLLREINGRREMVSSQTIAAAQDRIQHQPGKGRLHFLPQPRRTEPISPAARVDALENPDRKPGQLFSSGDLVQNSDGSWRSKTPQEQARDREAAEKANQPTVREKLSAEEQQWRKMAEELCGYGSHGNQAAIKQTFDQAVASGADWRRVYEACNRVVAMFKRGAAVRGWAGR